MALGTTASVTRSLLGLGNLDINDHVSYVLSYGILGANTSWERNQVKSQWVDGDVTVSRRRGNVIEPMVFHVYGNDQSDLQSNISTLIDAFIQDSFTMTIDLDGSTYQYSCESADHSVEWGYKMHSAMTTVTFQVPRKPIALAGV